MLDRIQNNGLDNITQGQNLEKISSVGSTNPFEKEDLKNYLVDESDISTTALEKYQKELDIQKFSDILKKMDEKEANNLVLKNVFEGVFSMETSDILSSLSNNENLLNEVFKQI